MRNAQKTALMAMFAAIEDANEAGKRREPAYFEPRAGQPIQLDPLWLITRGRKGRA